MDSTSSEYKKYEFRERDLQEERPFGVSLVVVFGVLAALLNAFLALNAWIRAEELEQFPILAIVFMVEVAIGLGVSIGLWRLSEWARICAVLLYGFTFALNFITGFNETLTTGSLMALVIPAAIVIYLIQPQVKERFI